MNWTAPLAPGSYVSLFDLLYMGAIIGGMWIFVLLKERRDERAGRHID